jgi:hypothetical protein
VLDLPFARVVVLQLVALAAAVLESVVAAVVVSVRIL